jgi:hypothetical protein
MNRAVAGIAAVLLLVPGGFALTGCGSAVEEAVEQGIEQGAGGDVEINDDGLKVTDEEGNEFAIGGDAELPSTWPETVPVPEGTLLAAGSTAADGSSGAIAQGVWQSDASVADAAEAYGDALTSAGFSVNPGMSVEDGKVTVTNYEGNGFEVGVIVAEGEGGSGASLSVTVTEAG